MHEVDWIGAFWARFRRSTLLQLLAAFLYWLLTTALAGAQPLQPQAADAGAPEMPPSATSSEDSQPRSAWRALERNEEPAAETPAAGRKRRTGVDPAGSLGLEIVGGVLPAIGGVALVIASLRGGSSGGHVPVLQVDTALLSFGVMMCLIGPPTGVAIAGHATGGTGSVGFTFLGALGGLLLSVPGVVIGSIIGYRASADDEPAEAQATLMPILGRYEIGLEWSGALDL